MDAKYLASVLSFLSIFLAVHAQNILVPNYDNVEHEMKFFERRYPLVLSCNITQGTYELKWYKDDVDVTKVSSLEGRHQIIPNEHKFIIDRTNWDDDGKYSCEANKQRRDINVIARPFLKMPAQIGVVEGETLTIHCESFGTNTMVSWVIGHNLTLNQTTDRYVLKADDKKVENAILTIDNVSLDDRGEFKCVGSNDAVKIGNFTEFAVVGFVRVKGKLAALWPFLGICTEVLILCAIILIYEKRRNKTELEESDTDPQEQ